MKKTILPILFLIITFPLVAQYVVTGGEGSPYLAVKDSPNRMQVYLLNGLNNASISFTSSDGAALQWYKYKIRAIESIPVPSSQSGNTSTITNVESDYGYFVGNPADMKTSYLWIIDYSKYLPVFNSLKIDDSGGDACTMLKLLADIDDKEMRYYTYNGIPKTIDREYSLQYNTLKWDENSFSFHDEQIDDTRKNPNKDILVEPPPLKDTEFKLTGDEFARHFGLERELVTGVYQAIAVEAHVDTTVTRTESDNQQSVTLEPGDIGGSAPIDITFTATANEPVGIFYIWKLFDLNKSGTVPVLSYADETFNYTFDKAENETKPGRYLVQLEVSDRSSVCVDTTQQFNVTISVSSLKAPNFFTPDGSPGVNDVFKVSYKSITEFRGWIFSQWGNELFHWTDPAQGWDGKVRGKIVPTGVYYYVIEAKGADGHHYKLKGDINILRKK